MITAGMVCHFLDTDVPRLNETLRRVAVAELHLAPSVKVCIPYFTDWVKLLPEIREELQGIEDAVYGIRSCQSIEEIEEQSLNDLRERILTVIGQLDALYPGAGVYEGWER